MNHLICISNRSYIWLHNYKTFWILCRELQGIYGTWKMQPHFPCCESSRGENLFVCQSNEGFLYSAVWAVVWRANSISEPQRQAITPMWCVRNLTTDIADAALFIIYHLRQIIMLSLSNRRHTDTLGETDAFGGSETSLESSLKAVCVVHECQLVILPQKIYTTIPSLVYLKSRHFVGWEAQVLEYWFLH